MVSSEFFGFEIIMTVELTRADASLSDHMHPHLFYTSQHRGFRGRSLYNIPGYGIKIMWQKRMSILTRQV